MSHVVALAKAEVEDNPTASSAIRQFASIRTKDAEKKAHEVLKEHDLTVRVPIERMDLDGPLKCHKSFPYIKFSSWVRFLWDTGRLARALCACSDFVAMSQKLEVFWKRYRGIYPSHKIFQMEADGLVDLRYVIPVYSHSDEGRSQKHMPLWVLSVHGAVGRGTQCFLSKNKDKIPLHRSGLALNFIGATWTTQFMHSCMLRRAYKKTPKVLDEVVEAFSADMADLLLNGVAKDGCVIRVAHLGTKGDLPALGTLGHMEHTFRNAPKASKSQKACEGICWMCCGGKEAPPAVPYEDFSTSPLWEATLGQQEIWKGETPPILLGVPLQDDELWSFYKTDVWHNFHMGVAKYWAAGSLVGMLENIPMWEDATMEERLQSLNADYHGFCLRKKVSPVVDELGRETLGWPTAGTCPCGSWNKGSASTHFMAYLDDFVSRHQDACKNHPLLSAIVAWIFLAS